MSSRALNQDGVEFKRRDRPEKTLVPRSQIIARVKQEIGELEAAIQKKVVPVPYDD